MDRELLQRFNCTDLISINQVPLTPFPIGNFVNPGISVQVYDFLLPLRGKELFETTKPIISESLPNPTEKKESPTIDLPQKGFGKSMSVSKTSNPIKKIDQLGGKIYNAMMSNAKVDVDQLLFVAKTPKKVQKRLSGPHKFTVE